MLKGNYSGFKVPTNAYSECLLHTNGFMRATVCRIPDSMRFTGRFSKPMSAGAAEARGLIRLHTTVSFLEKVKVA